MSDKLKTCPLCRSGKLRPGTTTTTLTRGETTLVIKEVPADVCENCGESYISDDTAGKLYEQAEEAMRMGVEVDVRRYAPETTA